MRGETAGQRDDWQPGPVDREGELGRRRDERNPVELDRTVGQHLVRVNRGDDQVHALLVEHVDIRPLERHPLCLRRRELGPGDRSTRFENAPDLIADQVMVIDAQFFEQRRRLGEDDRDARRRVFGAVGHLHRVHRGHHRAEHVGSCVHHRTDLGIHVDPVEETVARHAEGELARVCGLAQRCRR